MKKLILIAAFAAAACGNESYSEPPQGAQPIGVISDSKARYYLVGEEKMPNGRLHAMVLMQFPGGRDGSPIGYQIDCANGPRWYNAEGDSLEQLRARPVADDRLTMKDRSEESQQVAIWLCDR
jgi:hypothetical protein